MTDFTTYPPQFSWGKNGPLIADKGNWCYGQPNNFGGNEEKIVSSGGCWYDSPANLTLMSICEEFDSEFAVENKNPMFMLTSPLY